jgi:hypothetical protein
MTTSSGRSIIWARNQQHAPRSDKGARRPAKAHPGMLNAEQASRIKELMEMMITAEAKYRAVLYESNKAHADFYDYLNEITAK